ncbi:MAG: phage portal protein [Cellulomonas sp.]|nr:phage portal protein [Cellulomonas sp.]MCR6647787.1 phage portal protein [Cellulomonas sp.]
MKALQQLARMARRSSIENPSTPLNGVTLADATAEMFGGSSKGLDPMRLGTVYRCVSILSSGVAGCPLRVQTRNDDRTPVHLPVLEREFEGTTPFELWETVVAHLALRGNAYLRKVWSADGRLVDLVPINPTRVKPKVDDEELAALVGRAYVKYFEIDGGRAMLTTRDVLHIPGLSLDGVEGLSPIGYLRRTFDLATAAENVAVEMFDHGMLQPVSVVYPDDLTDEQVAILKARWRAKSGGIDNAGDPLILDHGAKLEKLTLSPSDVQFLETRKFSTTEIARIFGVPGWIVNDQEKSTSWGTGMEQQFISFVVLSLKPYFHRIEQRVTREICDPRTEKAEFKVEGLLRGDSKARAAFYGSGIQHGWLVPNDIRPLEDLPLVPWGDEPYRPFNESASAQQDDDTTKSGDEDDDDADA